MQKDTLKKAIVETFKNRKTETQFPHPIFSADFAKKERRLIQWQAFLRKSKLEETIDFQEVMKLISEYLLPIYVDLIL